MEAEKLREITGVILVGGKSRRMGRDKAFLLWRGAPLLEQVLRIFRACFATLFLAGGDPERYGPFGVPQLSDLYPGSALGGLYTGLIHAPTDHVFVASCDLPYPSEKLLRYLCSLKDGYDCVVAQTEQGPEPLFAVYAKSALPVMRELLEAGNFRIYDLYPRLNTRYVEPEELAPFAAGQRPFLNVNTPEEFARLKEPQS